MSHITLKPCLQCGRKYPVLYVDEGISKEGAPFYRERIICRCGMQTRIFKTPNTAGKRWNNRKGLLK